MSSVANATRRMVRGAVGIGSILGGGGNGASVGTTAIENAGFVSPGMVSGGRVGDGEGLGASPSHDDSYLEPWGEYSRGGAAGSSSSSKSRLRSSYASSSPAGTIAWRPCPGKVILGWLSVW